MEKIKKFLFENKSTRQIVIKNTFWMTVSTTLIKIVRAIIIIYIARFLGTENYGIYTYLASLITIFSIFSDIGLTGILTREITKFSELKNNYISTTLVIKLLFLSLTLILIYILGPIISKFPGMRFILLFMGISMIFESLRGFFYSISRSENKMQVEAGLGIATELLCTFLVLIIFAKNPSIFSLVFAYMIGNGIGLFITTIYFRKKILNLFLYFKKELVLPIFKASIPFAVMGILGIFMTSIDALIIGILGNAHVLGLYAAAQRPVNLFFILPGFLSTSIFTILNQFIKENKKDQVTLLIKKSYLLSIAIAMPIVFGGIIIASPLISVIYGNQYIEAVLIFQLLLSTLLFVFPSQIFTDIIVAENKQRIFIKSSIIGGVINVSLDFILIPILGILGSAIATFLALLIVFLILYWEVKKIYTLNLFSGIKKIILATILMSCLVFIMVKLLWPLAVIILLAVIIYFGFLFLSKEELLKDIRQGFKI